MRQRSAAADKWDVRRGWTEGDGDRFWFGAVGGKSDIWPSGGSLKGSISALIGFHPKHATYTVNGCCFGYYGPSLLRRVLEIDARRFKLNQKNQPQSPMMTNPK